MLEPAHKFRLYPSLDLVGLYALVNVWHSKAEMRRHAREVVHYHKRTYQMFTSRTRIVYQPSRRLSPMFAEVNMQVEYTCVGAVSHELVHVTTAYFARLGLVHDDETDELYAHVQGWLLLQFVHRAQKAHIYV